LYEEAPRISGGLFYFSDVDYSFISKGIHHV